MARLDILAEAHARLERACFPGAIAIDATAGNGHDTVCLARWVGASGRVHAFDVQEAALEATRRRLTLEGLMERVTLHHASHALVAETLPAAHRDRVAAVVFNLGYLPGADHSITTETPETIRALDCALQVLTPRGCLAVVCYPGHPEGAREAEAVEDWFRSRETTDRVETVRPANTKRPAPFLLALHKA